MEPYTFDSSFGPRFVIDDFISMIWTERYYGDSDIELVVPATPEMIQKLAVGTFIGIADSDEVMLLENMSIKDGKLKVTGNSVLVWFNNRFVRASAAHEDRYWYISNFVPGELLWRLIWYYAGYNSAYLQQSFVNMGIGPRQKELQVPGLGLVDADQSGLKIKASIPYGPLYDAMREIATTYEIGMQIVLGKPTAGGKDAYGNSVGATYMLGFRSYKGLDRTSGQSVNSPVRFSPQMDSLTNIAELQSVATYKTVVYAFAPGNPNGLATGLTAGESRITPYAETFNTPNFMGFDVRALMIFAEDLTTDKLSTAQNLKDTLVARAHDALTTNKFIKAVDGEIVPENQFTYGIDYNLGDIIEVEGYSGTVQTARITEYIRAQDEGGEKAYPTVSMIT